MSDWEFFLKLCGEVDAVNVGCIQRFRVVVAPHELFVMPPTAPVNGPTPEEGLGHAPPAPPLTPEETDMARRLNQGFRENGWWGRQ